MRKKILGIVTIVTLVLMMLVTSVNAAEFTADKAEVKKGDIVTLTVKVDDQSQLMQFDVAFDTSKYEYVENSAKSALEATSSADQGNGTVRVSAFTLGSTTTDTLTLQFKAIENGENVPFTISNVAIKTEEGRVEPTFASTTVNVTVADPTEEPTDPTDPENPGDIEEPTDPTEPENPGDTEEPTKPEDNNNEQNGSNEENGSSEYVDEEGNPITRLPQTGSLLPAIAVGAVILVAAAIITFKAIKK